MFIDVIRENFKIDEPIFTEEILKLFPKYSNMQVFRYIKQAIINKELVQFSKGIYYMSKKTIFGDSTITADAVVKKRYLINKGERYGIYGGHTLQNMFQVTDQVPFVLEIVSNNESSRKRMIEIDGRRFILRKSHTNITKDNYGAYTILQLFDDLSSGEIIGNDAREEILNFKKKNNVSDEQLINMSIYFRKKVVNNMLNNKILYATT